MNNKKTIFSMNLLAIMSLAICVSSTSAIASALEKLVQYYPDVPYNTVYQLATIPSIISMILALILGPFVGKKLTYKGVNIVGMILLMAGGIGPVLALHNFTFVMICRVVFGMGLGMTCWSTAIIMAEYKGEERASNLGIYNLIYSLFAMAIASLTGILADISVEASFFVYALVLIPLLLVIFFMKEPESTRIYRENAQKEEKQEKKVKVPLNSTAWLWMIIGGVVLLVKYPVYLQTASYLTETGLGTAAIAGTVISCYTIGNSVAALVFGKLDKMISRYIMFISMFTMAVNLMIVLFTHSLVLTYVSYFLGGFGFSLQGLARSNYIAASNEPSAMAMYVSLNSIFIYGVMFISTYYIAGANTLVNGILGGESIISNWWICLIVMVALSLWTLLMDPRPAAYIKEQTESKEQ